MQLTGSQRFRNNALEVNVQKADQRFQGMGHMRRVRKWAKQARRVIRSVDFATTG